MADYLGIRQTRYERVFVSFYIIFLNQYTFSTFRLLIDVESDFI